jgi:hypothetical protein
MQEPLMGRSHYYVMYENGMWKIQCDGENSEPYRRKRDAFRDAVALAHLDERNGRQAEVFIQSRDFMFRPAWTSDRDPYPPPLVPES